MRIATSLTFVLVSIAPIKAADDAARYLDAVRDCVEVLIEHGTDRYGPIHTPVLMNILDVQTRTCPEQPLPLDEAYRVTRRERRGPAGGNLYLDQATLLAMHRLSRATGQPRYARFADTSMAYYVQHLVDDRGFFWWGWHRHYDAYRDVMTGHQGDWHELHIQRAIWPELWNVDSEAVTREIEAIWEWHVVDKATGECNRHGDGRRGCDFAMSGGEILRSFAFLYRQTQVPAWRDRARLVADYYWRARDPATDLIPNRPNAGRDRFDGSHFDTSITAHLCPCLLDAADWTGDPAFRDQAVAYLRAYAKYGWDENAAQYWGSLHLDGTPVPGPRTIGDYAQYEPRGHIDLWQPYAAGYEHPLPTAVAYADACQRLDGDAVLRTAARRWADCIRRNWPPRACVEQSWYGPYARQWAPQGTYAAYYGQTISCFLRLHALTGDTADLEFARTVADEALEKLAHEGLFRGHPGKPYYESMDGVGDLLAALLELHAAAK